MSVTHLRRCIEAGRSQVLRLFRQTRNSSLYELSVCIGDICECLENYPTAATGFPGINLPPREYTGEVLLATVYFLHP